jgi:hypothetical protein
MTAVVCQLDKLVAAKSQLAYIDIGAQPGWPCVKSSFARSEGAAAFWHSIGSRGANYLFVAARFWRLRLRDNGSSVPRVCSGEQVMPRDRADRCEVTPSLEIADPVSATANSRLHLSECRNPLSASPYRAQVRETAQAAAVEPRALAVRALLQLPRVASYDGYVSTWQVQRELRISAKRLRRDLRAARGYVPSEQFALGDLAFEEVGPSIAHPVLTLLHYLRSARSGSRYFALVDPVRRLPVTLCSVSALQWKCVGNQIRSQFATSPERIWEISRVYSVDSAPRNAISLLLSRVRRYLRRNMPSIDLLVTAVDLNLGFTGSCYRAANWQQWMSVKARPYLYENRRYVTPRQLRERYGTASLVQLRVKFPGRFQKSRVTLPDTIIYCDDVNGDTRAVPAHERRRLHR